MPIKSETIAKLLFDSAIQKRIRKFISDGEDTEFLQTFQSLYDSYSEDFQKEKHSPIEKIMHAILMNCHNGMNYVAFAAEEENPFRMFTVVSSQVDIGKYRCDFLLETCISENSKQMTEYTISKIIIECDGHDFHEKTKEQVARDKKRDRFLTTQGYKLLRFSGSEIYNSFEDIIDEIDEILYSDTSNWVSNNKALFHSIIGD